MDSDETHEMYSAGNISKSGVSRSDWKSGGDGKRLQERGVGLTGNSLPCKEQSIACGAAGGNCCERQQHSH